jgi:hypothetical protein
LNSADRKLLKQYKALRENNLLYRPYVYLKVQDDLVVTLYLDSSDYDRIKIYKRQKLQDDNKKVRIEASVTMIDSGVFNCDRLRQVEIVVGETLQRQGKFRIEDYN